MHKLRKVVRPLLLSVVIGALVYVVIFMGVDLEDILAEMGKLSVWTWAAVLGLSLFNYALRYLRWEYYLSCLGVKLKSSYGLSVYMAGFAFTTTPGKVGEVIRSYYLSFQAVTYDRSMAVMIVERIQDLLVIALLALFFVFFFQGLWIYVVLLFGMVAILAVIVNKLEPVERALKRWIIARFSGLDKIVNSFSGFVANIKALMAARYQIRGAVIGLIAWGAEGVAFYLILEALGSPISPIWAVAVYAAGILIGAASLLPGGLGSTELSMYLFLTTLGVEGTTAATAILVCRVATLWFAVILGFLAITGLEVKESYVSVKHT